MVKGYSITGTKHTGNQDSFYIAEEFKDIGMSLYIVADGMGGHAAGDIASKMAIEEITGKIGEFSVDSIVAAINSANIRILEESKKAPELEGMGTTVVLCAIKDGNMIIAHVGDSKAYVSENGCMEHITKDHSYVQQLVDNGEITPREAKTHPMKNIITNAVGVQEELKVDIKEMRLGTNCTIILCSDGVSNVTDDEEIVPTAEIHMHDSAEYLCKSAMENGNTDDATAIVINL